VTDHRKQLITDARVKGSGMALADLVCKTTFKADRGDANRKTQKMIPITPTGFDPTTVASSRHSTIRAEVACICLETEPGSVDDLGGQY